MNKKVLINMQFDTVTPLIKRFNNLIDALIKDFKEFNLDDDAIIFLAQRTRNFINFTKIAFLKVILIILERDETKFDFKEILDDINQMVDAVFEGLNKLLDDILAKEDEDAHAHAHSHSHSHAHEHHDIEVDNLQEYLDKITEYLGFIKKLLGDTCEIVLSSLKYKNREITEKEYNDKYNAFKENINSYKKEFEQKFQ